MCTAARLGIGQVTCVKECWEIDANWSRKQKAAFGLGADAFGASQAGSETTPRAASVRQRIYQRTTQMPERSILGLHPSSTMLPTALLPPPSAPRSPPSAHLMQRKRLFCRRCCSTEICCCAVWTSCLASQQDHKKYYETNNKKNQLFHFPKAEISQDSRKSKQ